MKKQIGLFTAILFAVSTLMVSCSSEVHEHTFAEEWKTDENFHWKECECGEIKFDAEHTFGKWEVTKEATEKAEGSQERVCDVCKYKETEEIAKLEHTHKFESEWTYDKTNHWHAATCGCSDVELQKTEHSFGDWITTKEATEKAEGSQERVCDVCKYKETAEIAQLEHKHVAGESWKNDDKNHWKECTGCKEQLESAAHEYEWTVTKDATCTEIGSKTGVCEVWKKEVTEKIDAKGHSESWKKDDKNHWKECTVCKEKLESAEHEYEWIVTIKATCTEEGTKTGTCKVCKKEVTEKIDAKGHSGIWEITTKPTGTESGQMQRVCKECGEIVTKELQPVPERFVLVEAGTFQMGCNKGRFEEKPVHEVTITKPFYMGKYEVTQAEYEKYCSYTGTDSPIPNWGYGAQYPAYYVSWYDALVYCNKRSMAEGLTPCYSIDGSTDPNDWGAVPTDWKDPLCDTWDAAATCDWNANGYRLPTEAEWEYAARAGDNTVDSITYSGTSDVNELDKYAWHNRNSHNQTEEVGSKKANAFGLYDMSGNVYEWCWNWFISRYDTATEGSYDTETEGGSDPTGSSAGTSRVNRGGAWSYPIEDCTVFYRHWFSPSGRYQFLGFRVVRLAN